MVPKEKSEGEQDRDSYSCFILGDWRGKMIKRLLQRVTKRVTKNLSGWEQSPDIFSLFRAQLQAVCPCTNLVKLFLFYFCSSQTENSHFYSLKPPCNRWKCLTAATTHRLLPIITPVLLPTPATASSQSPQQEKSTLHPPCDPLRF